MEEVQEKANIFGEIWHEYTKIKDILLKAKMPESKLPDYNDCQLLAIDTHINRMRNSKQWINHFITKFVDPWRKVRSENPESYWDDVINLGMGENLTEVRKLDQLSKTIRKEWMNSQNFLAPKPKAKTNE